MICVVYIVTNCYTVYSIIATRAIKRVYRNGVFAGKILERACARGILLWKPLRYRVFRPCCDQCLFNRKWINGHFLHSRRHKYNAIFARVHIYDRKKSTRVNIASFYVSRECEYGRLFALRLNNNSSTMWWSTLRTHTL